MSVFLSVPNRYVGSLSAFRSLKRLFWTKPSTHNTRETFWSSEETDPASLFSCEVDNPLLEVAGDAFRQTGQHVVGIMFSKFRLMSHLAALRKYLLLGQVNTYIYTWYVAFI